MERDAAEKDLMIRTAFGKGLTYQEAQAFCNSGVFPNHLLVTNYGYKDDDSLKKGRFFNFLNGSGMETLNVNRMLSGYMTIGVASTKTTIIATGGSVNYYTTSLNLGGINGWDIFPRARKSFHEIEAGYGYNSYVGFDANKAIAAMIIHDYTISHRTNQGTADVYVTVPQFNPTGHDTAKYGEFWACLSGRWITKETTDRRLHNGFWGALLDSGLLLSTDNNYTYRFIIRGQNSNNPYSGVTAAGMVGWTYDDFDGFHW